MEREPALRRLTIGGLLSFGERATTVELQSLNVLIGSNGSGKSNLIEVLGLLQNAPKDLAKTISNGGSIDEWLWKGSGKSQRAYVEAAVSQPKEAGALLYSLGFAKVGYRFEIVSESIEDETSVSGDLIHYYRLSDRRAYYHVSGVGAALTSKGADREIPPEDINPYVSILAQLKDREHYPEITYLGDLFTKFRLYRGWEFGANARLRDPCDVSLQGNYLEEDGSNLGVVLDRLLARPKVKDRIVESLRMLYENTRDLRTTVEGGKVQTRLEEAGLNATIPLIRMSDGTVRWLALLAILLDPDPPPLVVVEEPELGLHPDMIRELGKLLVDASERMQLIVTTHSTQLVEEFTDNPEAVIVCEKENGTSRFKRLDTGKLSSWLAEYNLGQLWTKGQIGGNRW